MKGNKIAFILIFIFLIHFNNVLNLNKKRFIQLKKNNNLEFVNGLANGFGMSQDDSNELKKCFINKQNGDKIIKSFITQSSKQKSDIKTEKKIASSFTQGAINLFSKFKECAPLKQTVLSFVKHKLVNLGIKGISFAVGGIFGLILKSSYDLFKVISEIKYYYTTSNKKPVDYFKLGASIGRLVYYSHNLLMKRK